MLDDRVLHGTYDPKTRQLFVEYLLRRHTHIRRGLFTENFGPGRRRCFWVGLRTDGASIVPRSSPLIKPPLLPF